MRKKHFQWAASLAVEAGPNLYSGKRLEWTKRLKADHNNLRYALGWALEEKNDPYGGLEIINNIGEQYWNCYDYSDAFHLLDIGYEMMMVDPAPSLFLQVRTLFHLGSTCCLTNPPQSLQYLQKAFSLSERLGSDAKILRACILAKLGEKVSNELGDLQKGLEMLSEAEVILRESGSAGIWNLGHTLNGKAWTLRFIGNETAAQAYFDEYTSLILELGDVWGGVFWPLADGAWRREEFDLAKKYCEEYRIRSREMELEADAAHIDRMLANWERARGMYAEALLLYRNALALYNNKAVIWGVFLTLIGLASNQVGTAQSVAHENSYKMLILSTQLLAAIQTVQEEYHTAFYFEDRQIYDQALDCAKKRMKPADFNIAWAQGRTMHLKQIVTWALENMK
jgi:tetratricopeptide (TPR) repeat protein